MCCKELRQQVTAFGNINCINSDKMVSGVIGQDNALGFKKQNYCDYEILKMSSDINIGRLACYCVFKIKCWE